MGSFYSLLNSWIANSRTKRTIKNIERNNQFRKNIVNYGPSDIEAFIERGNAFGSYIASGGTQMLRSRVAAAAVVCAIGKGIPVIVLHESNDVLEQQIYLATQFTNNKYIINNRTPLYDPFFNRTDQEICNLIMESSRGGIAVGATGRQYLEGITRFIRSKKIPPYCDMFLSCPHDDLFDKIDESIQKGYIPDKDATTIRNLIMQGQSERPSIQSFFSQLGYQGKGILSDKTTRTRVVNIKEAIKHGALITINVGSSTNEVIFNVILNEIKEVLACGKQIMIVIDAININSNKLLEGLLRSQSSNCFTTILAADVYSTLGADDNLFATLIGNSSKCIVFQHPLGISCNKWSEVFGTYNYDKVTQNIGNMSHYEHGYGFGESNSISVSTSREYIVRPEEIAQMQPNEAYIFDKALMELAHTTVK